LLVLAWLSTWCTKEIWSMWFTVCGMYVEEVLYVLFVQCSLLILACMECAWRFEGCCCGEHNLVYRVVQWLMRGVVKDRCSDDISWPTHATVLCGWRVLRFGAMAVRWWLVLQRRHLVQGPMLFLRWLCSEECWLCCKFGWERKWWRGNSWLVRYESGALWHVWSLGWSNLKMEDCDTCQFLVELTMSARMNFSSNNFIIWHWL